MAYTATIVKQSIMGNERVTLLNVTADANQSGTVSTSLGFLDSAVLGPISMSTAGIKVKVNTTGASAASNGNILISGCTSGDNFFLVVYGRS